MVKLRFKHEYIGLKVFETLVNRSADYANHFMVDAPGIYAKEHRGNKGRGMVYCTLTDMMTARAVPLNVLRVSRSGWACVLQECCIVGSSYQYLRYVLMGSYTGTVIYELASASFFT